MEPFSELSSDDMNQIGLSSEDSTKIELSFEVTTQIEPSSENNTQIKLGYFLKDSTQAEPLNFK